MYKFMNLRRFEENGGGNNGAQGGAGGNGSQGNAGVTYSFEQAEQIANDRANRATAAALRSYFQQQGMTQQQAEQAMQDYRTRQQQNDPATRNAELERQLSEANGKLQAIENKSTLAGLGVGKDFTDFVAFEVQKMVTDKKDFATAAKEYIAAHPGYARTGYQVNTGVSGAPKGNSETKNEAINNMIRGAIGRR